MTPEEIIALFHACGYPNHSRKTWDWWQRQGLFWAATEHCFYAAVPRSLHQNGETIHAAFGVQLVSHPQHRKLTELVQVIRNVAEQARLAGCELLFGIPNDTSRPVLQKLFGWQLLDTWNTLAVPTNQLHATSGAFDLRDSPVFDEVDVNRLSVPGMTALHKDVNYLTWRYSRHPTTDYTVIQHGDSFLVLKTYDKAGIRYGHILEWGTDARTLPHLLSGAAWHFTQCGATITSTWLQWPHPLFERLCSFGFEQTPHRIQLLGKWLAEPKELGPWHLVMGDSDAF